MPAKFKRFQKSLRDRDLVHDLTEYLDVSDVSEGIRPIKKPIIFWSPTPLFELPRVAEEVKKRYEEFRGKHES